MGSCLGIYIGDKIVKYAKLAYDEKSKSMRVSSCGVKHVVGEKTEIIHGIVEETDSANIPLAINISNATYSTINVLKQLGKNDVLSMIDLEVFEIATKLGVNEKLLTYRYLDLNTDRSEANNKIIIAAYERAELDKYLKLSKIKPSGIYPISFVLDNIVDKQVQDYMYINIDETTDVITVNQGEIREISEFPIGMGNILSETAAYCGSTSKAYELCKSINVYTEEVGINDVEVEKIVEPVLQDILHRIEEKIKQNRFSPSKIYISGMGTLFTNIDLLFSDYFGIESVVAKPYFVSEGENEIAMPNIVECVESIALAHEYLKPSKDNINFASSKTSEKNIKMVEFKNKLGNMNVGIDKIKASLIFANVIAGVVLLLYIAFGIIYGMQTDRIFEKVSKDSESIQAELTKIQNDVSYIKENTDKYSNVNSFVEETVRKIEGNEIGKYSTYNVANFMQKIIRYIPKGVEIETISSNDNKHVTMVAKSDSYSGIGYFVSQIKLQEILINVVVEKVSHTSYVTVTIGGDLP